MDVPSRRFQFTPVRDVVKGQGLPTGANHGPIRKQSREHRKRYMREYMRGYRRAHPGLSTPYVRKYRAKKQA